MRLAITKKKSAWGGTNGQSGSSASLEITVEKEFDGNLNEEYDKLNSFIDEKLGAMGSGSSEAPQQKEEPATKAQLKKLDSLDVPYRKSITKKEASNKIDEALNKSKGKSSSRSKSSNSKSSNSKSSNSDGKPASKAQKKYLDDLGVEYASDITKDEASELIEENA